MLSDFIKAENIDGLSYCHLFEEDHAACVREEREVGTYISRTNGNM
jgi:hypothetical protein